MESSRKPLATAESKTVKSLRADSALWERCQAAADARKLDFSEIARDALSIGLTLYEDARLMEAYTAVASVIRGQEACMTHVNAAETRRSA